MTDLTESLGEDLPEGLAGNVGLLFVVCFFALDLVLIAIWASGRLSDLQVVGAHTLAVAVVGSGLWLKRDSRLDQFVSSGSLLFLLGPLGGPTLIAAAVFSYAFGRRDFDADAETQATTRRQPRSERYYQQIKQGRRFDPAAGRLDNFEETFNGSDKAAQNAAISAITRNFSPEMRPALDLALRSPNAALRVQAAAVFAKLRTSFSDRATEVLLEFQDREPGTDIEELTREARLVAHSGFVEDDLRRHLLAAAEVEEGRRAKAKEQATKVPKPNARERLERRLGISLR